ncbi:major capsid protein [uncultured Ruegeria sp.]|uniref:major capsid protein n=1 Tax=uncultured Ruegeria sp. TaxID=259304 RepID=UPI00260CAC14|nr:major capsid protein [uncultured Ruegeria sp.]
MATMDVFNSSAFSTTSLTGMVNTVDFVPSLLGSLGIFEPMPVRTRNVFVDRRDGVQVLIPTSADGAPPEELANDGRDAVPLKTTRLAKSFTLYAHEVDGIRAHGSETELESVQSEYRTRTQRLMGDVDLTHENMRLGALQGIVLDADGSTVINNYFTDFAEAQAAAVSFELDVATTNVNGLCKDIVRAMSRSARGSFVPGTQVHALAGDAFYDALIAHPNVEKFYMNWVAAQSLRETQAFEAFRFGNITFHNYRGTDDNSTVAIANDECKFFPVGARDVFKVAHAPLENMAYVNTPGRERYMMNVIDRDRDMWTKGEIYSYPLYVCQQPRVLRSATRT